MSGMWVRTHATIAIPGRKIRRPRAADGIVGDFK
jgi:hypothetical protein